MTSRLACFSQRAQPSNEADRLKLMVILGLATREVIEKIREISYNWRLGYRIILESAEYTAFTDIALTAHRTSSLPKSVSYFLAHSSHGQRLRRYSKGKIPASCPSPHTRRSA